MMTLFLDIFLYFIAGLILLLILGATAIVIYARWYRGTLEKTGIPVIKPHWFLGSNFDAHNKIQPFVDLERMQKYGHIYGVYDGRQPQIYISDPKLLKRIQTTDFEHFRGHRTFLIEHPIFSEILDFLEDEKWKEVRSSLTPHFTTGKIKQMCDTISDIAQEYVTALKLDMESNHLDVTKIDFRRYCPPLILEIIGKIFCGINVENARDPDNKFVKNMKLCLGGGSEDITMDWTFTLASAVPLLTKFFPVFPPGSMEIFAQQIRSILDARDKANVENQDMVNTLLKMTKKAESDPIYKSLGITNDTAVAQAFEFFIASYEAVRSILTFLIYYLATHPEIQERVKKEIDDILRKQGNEQISYETVAEMPYLTACLTEAMRLQPSFFRPDRRCTKDWEYDGIKIPKDMIVIMPVWAIHRDPASYPNPDVFDPDRFMPGNKEKLDPYAFGTFGNGPRACIGQRFSYQMLKIIVVHYLTNFSFQQRKDTQLKHVKGNTLFIQTEPIYVDFVKRSKK